MRTLGFRHVCVALLINVVGCSSSDTRRSTSPSRGFDENQADAAAYGMDHAFLGKEQKVRPPNEFEFYFKNCTQTDRARSFVSKTSYWCEEY